eukprot:3022410-Rhodomonas_salina.1
MRSLDDIGGHGVGSAKKSRFQIMQHGRDFVVIDVGKPEEFDSFDHLCVAAGGIDNLIDTR